MKATDLPTDGVNQPKDEVYNMASVQVGNANSFNETILVMKLIDQELVMSIFTRVQWNAGAP